MPREIKFRVWDKDNEEWLDITGNRFLCFTDGRMQVIEGDEHYGHEYENIELCEYTGLKDTNGKEIYEGDICKTYNGDIGVVAYGEHQDEETLETDKTFYIDVDNEERKAVGFFVRQSNGECLSFDNRTDKWITVIGNIYENPEMMPKE